MSDKLTLLFVDEAGHLAVRVGVRDRALLGHWATLTVEREAPALKIEDDHELVWVDPVVAMRTLRHDGHAWAVAKWMRGRGQ
jgi:8-oxo-dGTP diphosphatase